MAKGNKDTIQVGEEVYVKTKRGRWAREDLAGQYRWDDLCTICTRYNPEDPEMNCDVSAEVRNIENAGDITLVVSECAEFVPTKMLPNKAHRVDSVGSRCVHGE